MKYKIIGHKKVMDKVKGETITVKDSQQAKSLIKAGHIEPIAEKKEPKKQGKK